ncbi:unnamed protein product [Cuscuta campestris]|uniref:C2 and GRAM domain-containing protein n=1 Tax=Cuscuta campestris TaxID=132261 RepID=A0A484L9J7_9ASTE|nr:unnamed protein product [Cuscuta campestris]
MKLIVRVIEARNIPAMDPNGFSDPYVKLQVGKQRYKTKVVKKCLNPSWCEEFIFRVDDFGDELVISVLDEDKYFNDDFVGQLKVPVSSIFEAPRKSLGTSWYELRPKAKKAKNMDCGQILLTLCFSPNNLPTDLLSSRNPAPLPKGLDDVQSRSPSRSSNANTISPSPIKSEEAVSSKEEKSHTQTLAGRFYQIFNKNTDGPTTSYAKFTDTTELSDSVSTEDNDDAQEEQSSSISFEEMMRNMEMKQEGSEVPRNLPGVVLDQLYAIAPPELNSLLFAPDLNFLKSLTDSQGSTELKAGPWKFEGDDSNLKRVVSMTKAASRLVKALKATEEQTYLKADGKTYAVSVTVSTPDAPYGNTFKIETLYCITAGPDLASGEKTSRLVVSWQINFLQSTMMKSMIENGARQGIKDSFEQYASLLSQNVKPVDEKEFSSEKDQVLATLQVEPQSDWRLVVKYFANFTVISTFIIGLYVALHIFLAMPSTIQGLEFVGLDLPDSIGELIVCGVLVLQGKRVLELMSRFMQARGQNAKGGDHGIKAHGDGWLLTVVLLEGHSFAAVDSSGFSDPYVVFSCNGKTKTSSIKFQNLDPKWNEIFEFDAMDEPPSLLVVEVFDFDGPFDEATTLGHAEINFLKTKISDLSDILVPLQGKFAQACQSKLHLRIFLNNTKGNNLAVDYLSKMEKEVGKKIRLRSPQTNSAFQKHFGLPPEEFLINDFTCHLKRRMPLQGRLFLSPRIVGFHADLFGHKTKFFYLWEDIEDIQVTPPTLSSMGSPIVIMTLKPHKGFDARHGAKTQDEDGRLKFYYQSFVSFNVAHRTIKALWKARALSPEQKVQIVEESEAETLEMTEEESIAKNIQVVNEENEGKNLQSEDSRSFLWDEDLSMSTFYSSSLSVPTEFFMELFSGNELDHRIMERIGCLNYSPGSWESEKPDVYQRHLYYKFDKCISHYGGEVTSTQQKLYLPERNGWIVEEVMTLHGVPLGDFFTLHLKYLVEAAPPRSVGCSVTIQFGMMWLKYAKHQKRIRKNIESNLKKRVLIMFSSLEKEFHNLG